MLAQIYKKNIIERPKFVFLFLILILIISLTYSKDFRLDASSETLLIEGDPDLKYLNEVNQRYGSKEFLVLTYTPNQKMTSDSSVNNLLSLKYKIQSLDWVHNVITILDIPLLNTKDETLNDKLQNFSTLKSEGVNREEGFNEILNSPVFKNFVISEDGKTSGIIVYLKEKDIEPIFKNKKEKDIYQDKIKKENHKNILEIRNVIKGYKEIGKIHLGGIPMIADDMMTFIKSDMVVFGIGVLLFIILTLWFVFKKLIWIIVPISSCLLSLIIMIGLLGILGWKVTVISSNFIALMLILTMAMNIHMSTRFLQIKKNNPNLKKNELILMTSQKMFWPIIYTVLTTVCAFLSLIFSEIKPVIDFGWMMTLGLFCSFMVTFTLLPTLLSFLEETKIYLKENQKSKITSLLGNYTSNNKNIIFITTLLIIILSIFGISKLEVENSFINYFKKNTEIYKGMKLIDDKLGGTTPMDIIIKFPVAEIEENETEDEDWGDLNDEDNEKYWFTKDKINKIDKVHNYLESLPEVGKVLSFSSIVEVATKLNNDKPLGSLEMGVLYTKVPDSIKKEIVDPYISIKDSEARISLRIKDSLPNLKRNDLINKINRDLENKLGFKKEEFKLAGVLILFNNLLQSLFKSQILTLGIVMAGIFGMFFILFRNIKLS